MQFDTPHPAYTGSPSAKAGFRLAIRLALAFVGLLWAIALLNFALDVDVTPFGVAPRTVAGLAGIVFAPLMHAGFDHLIANTLPVVVMVTTMLHLYPQSSRVVLPAVWVGPGVAVWLFASGGVHVGASGIVFGLVAFVLVAGLIRRDRRAIAAAMAVAFLYGASLWGVLPIRHRDSWETHLAAAILGGALALVLRHRDAVPPLRYDWEGDDADPVVDLTPYDEEARPARMPPPPTLH